VSDGRRWLALDADLFAKRFTHDLHDRFGFAGIVVWMAFLCACKQSRIPGRVRMANDLDGMSKLGLTGYDLADAKGEPWTLTEFFDFTGRKKQTRRVPVQRPDSQRIANGRLLDVHATHWQRWQDAGTRAREAERKRTSRTQKRPRVSGHGPDTLRTNVRLDSDLDLDIPPTPQRGQVTSSSNGQVNPEDLVDLGTAVGELKAALRGDDG
jgi:hypothetical protein